MIVRFQRQQIRSHHGSLEEVARLRGLKGTETSLRSLVLEAFVACVADLDLRDPFGGENLVRCKTACWNGIEDRVDHITTLTLCKN
jgi:hypothetical protein